LDKVAFYQQSASVELVGISRPEEYQYQIKVENHLPSSEPLAKIKLDRFRITLTLIYKFQGILDVFVVEVLRSQEQGPKVQQEAINPQNRR
jgi:hypothetical protein